MEYQEITFRETQLRVYPTGEILRLCKGGRDGKKGEWVSCNNSTNHWGYYETRINGKLVKCHRIIGMVYLDLDIDNPKILIDHINRLKTDNRVENLRIVTNQQNQFNKSNTRGYSLNKKTNKYNAYISINGTYKHLGCFDTPEEAHDRYLQEKAILHII